jgi:hypothetical protein
MELTRPAGVNREDPVSYRLMNPRRGNDEVDTKVEVLSGFPGLMDVRRRIDEALMTLDEQPTGEASSEEEEEEEEAPSARRRAFGQVAMQAGMTAAAATAAGNRRLSKDSSSSRNLPKWYVEETRKALGCTPGETPRLEALLERLGRENPDLAEVLLGVIKEFAIKDTAAAGIKIQNMLSDL